MPGLVTQPQGTLVAPSAQGQGAGWGPAQACFLIREGKIEPQGHSKACPQTPGFLSLAASSLALS